MAKIKDVGKIRPEMRKKRLKDFGKIRPDMRKKINYEKVTFLGGFGGEPPKKKEIRSLQLLCSNVCL